MKALITGLLSFALVTAIGGAAVMRHFSPSAFPVFGASAVERGEIAAKPFAPRAGAENKTSADAAGAAVGDAVAPPEAEQAPPADSISSTDRTSSTDSTALTPKLEVSEHLDATGDGSSAELRFKDKVIEEKPAVAEVKKARRGAKTENRDAAVAASVHYGVRNRSELMTRANGPVANVTGRGSKANAPVGQLAGDAGAKLAEIQKQLDAAPLSPEEHAKLKKELDPVSKELESVVNDAVGQ